MALLVHIKRGGRLYINGAIIENASGRTTSVLLRNEATIMRGEDILPPNGHLTPATRIYVALQGAYLFPDRREDLVARALDLLDAYEQAAPSAQTVVADVRAAIDAGRLYAALKPCKGLFSHELRTMARVDTAPTGDLVPPRQGLASVSRDVARERMPAVARMAKVPEGAIP